MHFEFDRTRALLREVADLRMKRDDIAETYALALNTPERVDWTAVNSAIIRRWSVSGLNYIKERAWKMRCSS